MNLKLSFYWRPIANQSFIDKFKTLANSNDVPKVVIAGTGAWEIKSTNAATVGLDDYIQNLTVLSVVMVFFF